MHRCLILNHSCTNICTSQTKLLSIGKERGADYCWVGCCDLQCIHNLRERSPTPSPCANFRLAHTALLSIEKQRDAEDYWLLVVTCNLYTICALAISQTLLLKKIVSGANQTSVCWETKRCRVQKVIGLVFYTFNIDWILVRNWSLTLWSCVNYCLEQTTVLSTGKYIGTECIGVKGWLLRISISTESRKCLYGTKHTSVYWET